MMSFEEFFLKKKIDLKSLADTKPALFEEFKAHYAAMGEKSFDHTKKYWFNPLRKDFNLSDEDAQKLKETYPSAKSTSQENPIQNTKEDEVLIKPAEGFKPRFKAPQAKIQEEKNSEESYLNQEEVKKPAVFKPKFKAGISTVKQEEKAEPATEEKKAEETNKPAGFKPRFKAGTTNIKKTED